MSLWSAAAGMAAGVIGARRQAEAQEIAISEQRRQFEQLRRFWDDAANGLLPSRSRGPSLTEMERAHKARMAAEHAETMRQAKVGTWLLLAFVVAAAWNVVQLFGVGG